MHKNSVDIRRCRRCHVVEMNVVVCCERMGGRKCVDCWEECWTKYESLSVGQFRRVMTEGMFWDAELSASLLVMITT